MDPRSWSSSLSTSVFGRQKRSSGDYDDDYERSSRVYELSAFGRRMSLRLRSSPTSLVSPSFVVQHLTDNETWLATYDGNSSASDRWRCFHEGQVDGDPQSIVVLSTCSYLVSWVTLIQLPPVKNKFVIVSVKLLTTFVPRVFFISVRPKQHAIQSNHSIGQHTGARIIK